MSLDDLLSAAALLIPAAAPSSTKHALLPNYGLLIVEQNQSLDKDIHRLIKKNKGL